VSGHLDPHSAAEEPPDSPSGSILDPFNPPGNKIPSKSPERKPDLDIQETSKRKRLFQEATALQQLYCPCAGFTYNSLSGDRNLLVSSVSLSTYFNDLTVVGLGSD